jgi:hypothetical protein
MSLVNRFKKAMSSNFFEVGSLEEEEEEKEKKGEEEKAEIEESVPDASSDIPAKTPPILTALQVAEMINALPETMPMRAKRAVIRATIEAQGTASGTTADHILADATWGKMQINQQLNKEQEETNTQIRALEAQIVAQESLLASTRQRWGNLIESRQQTLRQYDNVFQFLGSEIVAENPIRMNFASAHNPELTLVLSTEDSLKDSSNSHLAENDLLPPHLRDDSVRKILGLK